tara:strand:- start:1 stop:492 length:492 start_codon:yes stop_codon:yes gene_type:complete
MDIDVVLEELKEIEEVKDIPTDDKYIKLKEEHTEELVIVIDNLYTEKYNERKKHIVSHFKSVGKTYDSNIFTNNYVSFIRDLVSGFNLTVDDLKGTVPDCYMKKSNSFSKCHYSKKHISTIVKINDSFWLSTYNETPKKMEYIRRIKNKLNIGVELLHYDYKD